MNINEVYARGGTLNDAWDAPFFHALRQWQICYKHKTGNGLAPCPNRDHHGELQRLLMEYEPDPIDGNAAAALVDAEYTQGLAKYGAAYESLTRGIWESHYVRRPVAARAGAMAPLPDLADVLAGVVPAEGEGEVVSCEPDRV